MPEIHETFVQADHNFHDFLMKTIRSAIDSDEIPTEVDMSALASMVLAILRGISMQWLLGAGALDLGAIKTEVRRTFELAFSRFRATALSSKSAAK